MLIHTSVKKKNTKKLCGLSGRPPCTDSRRWPEAWELPQACREPPQPILVVSQARSSPTQTLTLSDLKPSQGPRSGGTQVTITGTNLNAGSNVVVLFGKQPCLFHR